MTRATPGKTTPTPSGMWFCLWQWMGWMEKGLGLPLRTLINKNHVPACLPIHDIPIGSTSPSRWTSRSYP